MRSLEVQNELGVEQEEAMFVTSAREIILDSGMNSHIVSDKPGLEDYDSYIHYKS